MKNPIQIINECAKTGEPTFTIRAKDRASVVALEAYLIVIENSNCNAEFKEELKQIANEFHLWQSEHQSITRLPD